MYGMYYSCDKKNGFIAECFGSTLLNFCIVDHDVYV